MKQLFQSSFAQFVPHSTDGQIKTKYGVNQKEVGRVLYAVRSFVAITIEQTPGQPAGSEPGDVTQDDE